MDGGMKRTREGAGTDRNEERDLSGLGMTDILSVQAQDLLAADLRDEP